MTFFIISSEEDIEIGEYGIPAPRIGCPAYIDTPQALCLVPALALDARGRRIGYGGGYYDRFLPAFSGTAVVPIPLTVPGIRAVQSRAAADKNIGGIKRSGSIKSDGKRAEYIRHCSAGAGI